MWCNFAQSLNVPDKDQESCWKIIIKLQNEITQKINVQSLILLIYGLAGDEKL